MKRTMDGAIDPPGATVQSLAELAQALKKSTQLARDTIALSSTDVGSRGGEAVRLDKATMLIERAERQVENLKLFVSFQKQQFHPQAEQLEAHVRQQEEQISLILSSLSVNDKRRVICYVKDKLREETRIAEEETQAERERALDKRQPETSVTAAVCRGHSQGKNRSGGSGERKATGGQGRSTNGRGDSPPLAKNGKQGTSVKGKRIAVDKGRAKHSQKSLPVTSDTRPRRATVDASTESTKEANSRATKCSPVSRSTIVGVRPALPDPAARNTTGGSVDLVVPCIAEVSEEEYNKLLQLPNMIQRNLTREKLNAAIAELQKLLERKYRILGTASSRLQTDSLIRKYNKYKSQETARTKPFFCFLDEDLKGRSHIRLDETGRCILRVLARLQRIRKLGVGCYALANARRK